MSLTNRTAVSRPMRTDQPTRQRSKAVSHLGDLVDAGERPGPLAQVLVASVGVGPHRERGVVVARPLADDGDRDADLLHQAQGRVPRVVQPDLRQSGTLERGCGLQPSRSNVMNRPALDQ